MHWEDVVRVVNTLGCFLAFWFLATAMYRQWKQWNVKTQMHWWALFGWVFLGAEGSIESLLLDTQPGPRIIIQTLVVSWTIRALLINEELKADPSMPWKDKK